MSTNFYVKVKVKPNYWELHHIGKRSAGWCFSLHAIPRLQLMGLGSWAYFLMGDNIDRIFDEYENDYLWTEMVQIIIDDKTYKGTPPKRHKSEMVIGNGEEHYDILLGHFR